MAGDREVKAMDSTLATLRALKPDEQQRVHRWLADKLGFGTPAPAGGGGGGYPDQLGDGKLGTVKQFLKHKNPDDDVTRATTLAYFLTHAGGKPSFKTFELSKARIDAALTDFNMSRAVSHAKRASLLTSAGKSGTHQITSFGESLVEAMPDAEAVKRVLAGNKRRRRKSTGPKRRARAKRGAAKK